MAFSYEVYPGLTGVVTDFAVPFGFINRSHVTADVDGVSAPFTWLNDGMIRMTTAPTGNLTIARNTPKTVQVVTFTDGSTQSAELHNLQNKQLLYVTQEAYDTVVNILGGDGVEWDALGRQIKNVVAPTDPTDAANKAYVDAMQAAALAVVTAARDAAVATINTEEGAAVAAITTAEANALAAIASDVAAAEADRVAAAASAAAAATSETNAANSASTATIQAGIATTKAGEASTSASQAAASAAEAAGYIPAIPSQAEAEAGVDNTKFMTALRSRQADTAFRNSNSIGWNQVWSLVAGFTHSTSYQNTRGRPIGVAISGRSAATAPRPIEVSSNGSTWIKIGETSAPSAGWTNCVSFVLPSGWYYRINGSADFINAAELK